MLIADMPGAHPIGLQAVLGGAVVSSVCGTLGAAAYRHGGFAGGLLRVGPRAAHAGRRLGRPGSRRVAVQVAAAALVVVAMLGLGRAHVLELHRALDPGVAGGAVLTLGQALLLPNLVLWAAAALAGPGFAVGSATSVTLWSSSLGPLPALPALGALPAPGPLPRAALALLAVPVLAGVVAGVLLCRSRRSPEPGPLDRLAPCRGGRRRRRRRWPARRWRCSRGCPAVPPGPGCSPSPVRRRS